MSDLALSNLPDALRGVRTRPLLAMTLAVRGHEVGATPVGDRRVGIITGGRFEGDRLRGDAGAKDVTWLGAWGTYNF